MFTSNPTFDAYKQIFATGALLESYYTTILRTVLGTLLTVVVSAMLAYPLSKRYLLGRKWWMGLIIFTMFFGGGLIPTYLLVKELHMLNTIWSLVIPGFNATEYRLYENGVLIETKSMQAATPGAQSAVSTIAGRGVGTYEYRSELVNAGGVTSSDVLTVRVEK
ncbi:hypothetical protein P5G65_15635 [Paenibacillus chondroitinus]|uniref:Uncharacterized protein n=1 Tax=Paenibacillus chondroitinus TaxID=59842 RepID=A0ABU6DDG8_9BACL|nr:MULTISPECIES: hypothetical protein [Paenibacillus]MCY9656513.1 hypothetical protein [Paenibacillus anseongense]MEB4795337.1 hypothetical protein [Paenibacillus chondroitinus]